MKPAIIYVRVSTDRQAGEGVSLEAQEAKGRAWCLASGFDVASVHVDAGLSGRRADNRPALQAALEEVVRLRGVLVVYSLSRLARSTRDAIQISDRLDKAGADLASLSERLDTTSAAGKMIFRMMSVLAEFESDQISERTTMALGHMKAKGLRVGQIPYGWALAADRKSLVRVEDEQRVIANIRAMRAEGRGLREIARTLRAADLGQSWTPTSVGRILRRQAPAELSQEAV